MTTARPAVGTIFPEMSFPKVGGGTVTTAGARDRWSMLVVYRGKHCPKCKAYLGKLNTMIADWEAMLDIVVVSADTEDKAAADVAEFGWTFDLGYGLTEDQMDALGLYKSDPLSEAETDARFSEPGTFAFKPSGELMLVDISNGPASRPDLDMLIGGMQFNIDNDRPVRGTA